MYGGHDLRRGDRDPEEKKKPIWGGTKDAAPYLEGEDHQAYVVPLRDDPAGDHDELDPPHHVWQLQAHLRELGFLLAGEVVQEEPEVVRPTGEFGWWTEFAVREFQIYARSRYVAQATSVPVFAADDAAKPASWEALSEQAGAQLGAFGTSPYAYFLRRAEYDGPRPDRVTGVVDGSTRAALQHWLERDYRCPVVIEVWEEDDGAPVRVWTQEQDTVRWQGRSVRRDVLENAQESGLNVWRRLEVSTQSPRVFVRDFSGRYTFPDDKAEESDGRRMFPLTYFAPRGSARNEGRSGGPISKPPDFAWPSAEIMPADFLGEGDYSDAEVSTFKVVRAVSERECYGFFDSLTAYDDTTVSLGPGHWALQRGYGEEPGELAAVLTHLRAVEPDAIQAILGDDGLLPADAWDDLSAYRKHILVGWMAFQEAPADAPARFTSIETLSRSDREVWGDYLRSHHWFYRWIMLGRALDAPYAAFRRRLWDMIRVRIRDILDTTWDGKAQVEPASLATGEARPDDAEVDDDTEGRDARIGDFFTSEAAVGVLLRWHIRWPGQVVSRDRAAKNLRDAVKAAGLSGDPSTWTDDEGDLIDGLLDEAGDLESALEIVRDWPDDQRGEFDLADFIDDEDERELLETRRSFQLDRSDLPESRFD